jgi:hypothetical protein
VTVSTGNSGPRPWLRGWQAGCIVHVGAEDSMAKTIPTGTVVAIRDAEATTQEPATGRRDPEILAELFAPEIVLPEQFLQGARCDSANSGEKALMLAVLEDGIRCFQGHLTNERSNPKLLARQAEEWISADDWDWPFSFNNVCEHLCIDPDALRASLFTWQRRNRTASNGAESTPSEKKVYRLHLRTKRLSAVR